MLAVERKSKIIDLLEALSLIHIFPSGRRWDLHPQAERMPEMREALHNL